MKKVIRLTEGDLVRIVRRIVKESSDDNYNHFPDYEKPSYDEEKEWFEKFIKTKGFLEASDNIPNFEELISELKPFGCETRNELINWTQDNQSDKTFYGNRKF